VTDDTSELTPDELLTDEAKLAVTTPPEPIPDAAGLPDAVKDGNPDADDGSDIHQED
jgi:hypothetical protein